MYCARGVCLPGPRSWTSLWHRAKLSFLQRGRRRCAGQTGGGNAAGSRVCSRECLHAGARFKRVAATPWSCLHVPLATATGGGRGGFAHDHACAPCRKPRRPAHRALVLCFVEQDPAVAAESLPASVAHSMGFLVSFFLVLFVAQANRAGMDRLVVWRGGRGDLVKDQGAGSPAAVVAPSPSGAFQARRELGRACAFFLDGADTQTAHGRSSVRGRGADEGGKMGRRGKQRKRKGQRHTHTHTHTARE